MPFCCKRCNKSFKDNYNLNRHHARKTPCAKIDSSGITTDSSGITIINNFVTIILGSENISDKLPELMVNYMRETLQLGGKEFDYTRALKWITQLHIELSKEPQNKTIKLPNTKSMTAQILTENGWITKYTNEAVEEIFKIRSNQLVDLEESINVYNERVLKAPTIQRTMKHVKNFGAQGFQHKGLSNETRIGKSEFKVALIN